MSLFKAIAAALLLLTGCTVPRAEITPEGYLEVFGPFAVVTDDNIGEDWIIEGVELEKFLKNNFASASHDGSSSLTLTSGSKRFALLRRVKANLLAAPFLYWSWKINAFNGDEHPVRLIVGFHGGNPKSGSWSSQPMTYLGTNLPPHDRIIALTWNRDAARRGNVIRVSRIPRYVVRGGNVSVSWASENINLAALYRKIWPWDEHVNTRVMFIGFSARATAKSTQAEFADLVLSK